jgi:hypothetical protein
VVVIRKGHNVFQCRKCGITNAEYGDWYWVNVKCDECSVCFPPSSKVVNGGRYTHPAPDANMRDPSYYIMRKQRRKAAHERAISSTEILSVDAGIPHDSATG